MFFRKTCSVEIVAVGKALINDNSYQVPAIVIKPVLNKKLVTKMIDTAHQGGNIGFSYLSRLKAVQFIVQLGKNKMSVGFMIPKDLTILCAIMKVKEFVLNYPETNSKMNLDITTAVESFQQEFRNKVVGDYLFDLLEKDNKTVPNFEEFTLQYIEQLGDKWKEDFV